MRTTLLFIMSFSLLSNLFGDEIKIGAAAPAVSTIDHTGAPLDLGAELQTGITVVFFYPKAMTSGCTKQVCSMRDSWDLLKERDVKIFGASSDTATLQSEFHERHELPFALIADTDGSVSKAFGKGKWSRQAYIFRDGILVWRDLKASTTNQASDVLTALDELN
ncbi:MAG: peroxiredoxin [Opitutaceae bacterium]